MSEIQDRVKIKARISSTFYRLSFLLLLVLGMSACNHETKSSGDTSIQEDSNAFKTMIKEPYVPSTFTKFPYYDFRKDRHHLIEQALQEDDKDKVRIILYETDQSVDSLLKYLGQFRSLEALYVSGAKINTDQFQRLIDILEPLEHFSKLILNGNWITELPKGIGRLKGLKTLDLSFNDFPEIPEDICTLPNLEYLRIAKSKEFMQIPEDLGKLENLVFLVFSGTSVSSIPPSIGNCKKLMHITANASKLRSFPDEIGQCTNLKYINVGYNRIAALPSSIDGLTALENIAFGHNNIKSLPEGFGEWKQLRHCGLSGNPLQEFPMEVLQFKHLAFLSIYGTDIKHIPPGLADLTSLERLLVTRSEIYREDLAAIEEQRSDLLIVDKE